jgi:amino acid permease
VFREAGILVGILILLFIAFVGDYSLVLIVRAGHKSDKTSYQVRFL